MGLLDLFGSSDTSTSAKPETGLLGNDWMTALAAGLMEFGNGIRGGQPGAGMNMVKLAQQQKSQQALAQAAKLMSGDKPDMQGAFAILAAHPETAQYALQAMPQWEKLKREKAIDDMVLPALMGRGPAPQAGGDIAVASGAASGAAMPPAMGGGSVPAGAPAASQGAFPFNLNQVTALKLLGRDVMDQYRYAKDGIKRDAGAYYENPVDGRRSYYPKVGENMAVGPDGSVAAVPGAVGAVSALKGAEANAGERAKAAYDLTTTYGPGDTQGRQATRLSVIQGQGPAPGGSGGGQPQGGFANPSPGDVTYDTDRAKAVADQSKQIHAAADLARRTIPQYQQVGKLLGDFDGSKLSPTGVDIARMAKSVGITLDPKLPNKEAAMSLANEMALQLRNPAGGAGMPGAMSDADRNFLASMPANITQSAEGRKMVIDTRVKMLQRDADISGMARKWEGRYGRLDRPNPATGKTFFDNLQDWSERNALFGQ